MNIILGVTDAPPKQVSKTMTGTHTYEGAFRDGDSPSDRDPVIVVNISMTTALTYNYAEIFGAYYFIKDRKALTQTTTEITFHKDVLNTFDEGIRNQTCVIDRQYSDSVGDYDIDDGAFVVKRSELEILPVNSSSHTVTFVLGTIGIA